MSRKYCFLATEGPHDQAAITRLLQLAGFEKFKGKTKELDPFWEGFIPKYPKGGNLYTRMDMPTILTSPTHSVAIYCGEGSNLVKNIILIVTNYPRYAQEIHAFGLIVDADEKQPHALAKKRAKELQTSFPTLSEVPDVVSAGTPRTGIYVLPDNKRSGVLDSILVDCAAVTYPDHKIGASRFLNGLDSKHTQHLNAGARDKAVVACITSIIRPGQTNTSSIAQDNWITEKTITNKDIVSLRHFLRELLELPS